MATTKGVDNQKIQKKFHELKKKISEALELLDLDDYSINNRFDSLLLSYVISTKAEHLNALALELLKLQKTINKEKEK